MVSGRDAANSVQGTSKLADRALKMGTRQWNIGAVMTESHKQCGCYRTGWEKHCTAQMRSPQSGDVSDETSLQGTYWLQNILPIIELFEGILFRGFLSYRPRARMECAIRTMAAGMS
jgi:hypothetical protein